MTTLLEVSGLRKSYGDRLAVDDVSFEVAAGETFGLLGPNGAGKSTTMLMISGLLSRDAGDVLLKGEPVEARSQRLRETLGLVPQNLAIYPDLTARENLRFFGRLYGLRGGLLEERVSSSLERTGLSDRADDTVGGFSGGMKRRLNFGLALLHQPELVILDEPTVGVDPQSRAHLLNSVRELSAEGVAVIYVSHYMEEVQALCDRVAVIDHGRMVICDRLESLLARTVSEVRMTVRGHIEPPDHASVRVDRDEEHTRITIRRETNVTDRWESVFGALMTTVTSSGGEVVSVETEEPNLERLFLELTGSSLRD